MKSKKNKVCLKTDTYKLKEINPKGVVFIANGGRTAGVTLSKILGLPLFCVDIRYPLSRLMDRRNIFIKGFLWLFKELIYRVTTPERSGDCPGLLNQKEELPFKPGERVILVDDSVSSGRTIKMALVLLEEKGLLRGDIFIATQRCSRSSEELVDFLIDLN
ncbi:MAG: phosphoribosyltransferase [Deltaproteobacteria bacterium]|nr:phosphoribosyltransferase [Deltaproteobacteria bacterium]